MEFDITDLVTFIEKHQFKLIHNNVRQWGSYELAMSVDGHRWFSDRQIFGWGFSTHQAASITFKKYVEMSDTTREFAIFAQFMHHERIRELRDIFQKINAPVTTTVPEIIA